MDRNVSFKHGLTDKYCLMIHRKADEHLSSNYIITSERGQQYPVTLDRDLIS